MALIADGVLKVIALAIALAAVTVFRVVAEVALFLLELALGAIAAILEVLENALAVAYAALRAVYSFLKTCLSPLAMLADYLQEGTGEEILPGPSVFRSKFVRVYMHSAPMPEKPLELGDLRLYTVSRCRLNTSG